MELVDTLDLGSSAERCKSSSLLSSTIEVMITASKIKQMLSEVLLIFILAVTMQNKLIGLVMERKTGLCFGHTKHRSQNFVCCPRLA